MSDNNSKYDQPIAGHDYDGIQEFDNPLPMWWLWTFVGTIIFAVAYYGYYELGSGPSLKQELDTDMATIQKLKPAVETISVGDLTTYIGNPEKVKMGAAVFKEKCTACHGQMAEGGIGPNLADNFWIHGGGTPEDILAVVQNGVLEKGMPPWKDALKPEDLFSLVGYIVSVKGSSPPNGKAPEGKEVQ